MRHAPALVPALAALAALVAAATAQESRGPFVGLPAALSLDPGAHGLGGAATLAKPAGFATQPAGAAVHDLQAILAAHGGTGLDVDDFSTGLDWVQADDATGRVVVPQDQWAAITLSVTAATVGHPGSRLAAEAALPEGAGAALFSYVFPGSALPAPLVDAVERVHARTELGLPAAADLDAVDQLMPMWEQPDLLPLLPAVRRIYFTVDAGSVALVPVAWWGISPPPDARSGATILFVEARPGAAWSQPAIWKTPRELGLLPSDDIDGLAIDEIDQRIVLSTRTPALAPLLFLYYGTDGPVPVPLATSDGTPVGLKIGLVQNDDVDAVCAMDPSVRSHGNEPNAQFLHLGTPRPPALLPATLNGSACRGTANNTAVLHTWLTGWPPQTGPGPGLAALFLTFGDNLQPAFPLGPLFFRDATPVFAGDPQHHRVPIPAAIQPGSLRVTLRWFAADAAFTELAEAWPVQVRV